MLWCLTMVPLQKKTLSHPLLCCTFKYRWCQALFRQNPLGRVFEIFLLIAVLRKMPYFVLLRKKHQTSTNSTIFFFLLNAVKSLSLHKKFFFLQELLPRLLLEVFLHIFKSIAEFKKKVYIAMHFYQMKKVSLFFCATTAARH